MKKDPTEFRKRFAAWKNGKKPYENGRISDELYIETMEKVARDNWQQWGDESEDASLTRILNDNSYDYRGYYNKYPKGVGNALNHWTDEFKTVWHPSFSIESKYSGKKSQYNPYGYPGGTWQGEFFTPLWYQQNPNTPGFYKDGYPRIPKYKDGKDPVRVGEYNVYPSAIGASELNVTIPEVVITGTDKRPLYLRYDAKNSSYDPNKIRTFTDWIPVVGDIGTGIDIKNALQNQNYIEAGVLGATTILPSILRFPAKSVVRAGLKHAPEFTKSLYDISHLYITPKDNPRLRRYANEVSNLLLSDEMAKRGSKHRYEKQAENIANATSYFTHSKKHTFARPIYNIFGKDFESPIPIPYRYKGLYSPRNHNITVKKSGLTPDEIRQVMYHEASHASDLGRGTAGYVGFEPVTNPKYFGMPTEIRARVISILTDAKRNGVDINNFDEMSNFLNIDYKNPNYSSLLTNYKTTDGNSYLKNMMYGE